MSSNKMNIQPSKLMMFFINYYMSIGLEPNLAYKKALSKRERVDKLLNISSKSSLKITNQCC